MWQTLGAHLLVLVAAIVLAHVACIVTPDERL